MILHRLSQHLREQNWTAIAIEFVLLVAGVFLGIQAADWNADRIARTEERSYLERLQTDIQGSIERNRKRAGFMAKQVRYTRVVLDSLAGCAVRHEDRDSFASGLFLLGKSLPPVLERGVIDELNATGKFQYLRSARLRDALSAERDSVESSDLVFQTTLQRATPHVVYVESQIEYLLDRPYSGGDEVVWSDIAVDMDAVCRDARFRHAVSAARAYTFDMMFAVESTITRQEALLALIDAELEARR